MGSSFQSMREALWKWPRHLFWEFILWASLGMQVTAIPPSRRALSKRACGIVHIPRWRKRLLSSVPPTTQPSTPPIPQRTPQSSSVVAGAMEAFGEFQITAMCGVDGKEDREIAPGVYVASPGPLHPYVSMTAAALRGAGEAAKSRGKGSLGALVMGLAAESAREWGRSEADFVRLLVEVRGRVSLAMRPTRSACVPVPSRRSCVRLSRRIPGFFSSLFWAQGIHLSLIFIVRKPGACPAGSPCVPRRGAGAGVPACGTRRGRARNGALPRQGAPSGGRAAREVRRGPWGDGLRGHGCGDARVGPGCDRGAAAVRVHGGGSGAGGEAGWGRGGEERDWKGRVGVSGERLISARQNRGENGGLLRAAALVACEMRGMQSGYPHASVVDRARPRPQIEAGSAEELELRACAVHIFDRVSALSGVPAWKIARWMVDRNAKGVPGRDREDVKGPVVTGTTAF